MSAPLALGLAASGLVGGAGLAALHQTLLRRALRRALAGGGAGALLATAPLRVALPALGLLAAASLGAPALAGGVVGFTLGARALAARAAGEAAP